MVDGVITLAGVPSITYAIDKTAMLERVAGLVDASVPELDPLRATTKRRRSRAKRSK